MKNNYFSKLLLFAVLLSFGLQTNAQSKKQIEQIRGKYDLSKLQKIEKSILKKENSQKKEAFTLAKQKGWKTRITKADGSIMELQRVVNGNPIYYTMFNVDAARSTRTNHLNNGGSLGLNLMGQGMTANVWDGGGTRNTHREFDGAGGNNRVTTIDGSTLNGNSFHAQHVTGTIVASGVDADAKGMAPHAQARTADWNNDKSEATTEAANGMIISNHSYGFAFRDQFGRVQLPQSYFGGYIDESRDWDEILFNAPNYLMVVAAGNDGNDNTANQNPTGGSGWDKLTGHSTSKNNLVVANAQDANVDANGNLISVSINSSSSEGPTDDMRIKPDITGNGTGVYSTFDKSDSDYSSITGTSMASPNVAGSLLLLQQHYGNLNSGDLMRSATLKGLALHTADDAGASGPDAVFGWGLLNAKRAAEAITANGNGSRIEELTLNSGQTYTITVDADGTNPLLASISWTDRPGTAVTTVNSTTPVLVNDLDIRVTKGGTTFLPYELTGPTTSAKRDNNVDPFERVDVNNASGSYTITVTNKGSLVGGSQAFTLIVTGVTGTPAVCNATTPTGVNVTGVSQSGATVSWSSVAGTTYDVRYRVAGTSSWTTGAVSSTSANLNGLTAGTQYQVQVRSKCPNGTNSSYSATTTFTTSAPAACQSIPYSESFEANAGWTQVSGDDGDWVRDSGGTPSNNTGPSSGANGNFYMFLEASSNGSAGEVGANATAILESTCFDLSSVSSASFSFSNHMYGTNVGSLAVQASTNGSTWTNIWSDSGNQGNQWNDVSVNLSAYVGGSVSFRIVGTTGNGWSSDIAVDNIEITGGTSNPNPTPTYCASSGNRNSFEWIDNVELGGIANATGAGATGYSDFTSQVGTLARGSSNTMIVSAGFSGQSYTEHWAVWIDFNQDGTFADSEKVVSGSSDSADNLSATVDVPSGATLGQTRMRVSMKYNAAQTACENFADGEVEDYTINITSSTSSTSLFTTFASNDSDPLGNEKAISVIAYPNPATGFVQINLTSKNATINSYKIINTIGQTVQGGILNNSRVNISTLNAGMYILEVNDGQKSFKTKLVKR